MEVLVNQIVGFCIVTISLSYLLRCLFKKEKPKIEIIFNISSACIILAVAIVLVLQLSFPELSNWLSEIGVSGFMISMLLVTIVIRQNMKAIRKEQGSENNNS